MCLSHNVGYYLRVDTFFGALHSGREQCRELWG